MAEVLLAENLGFCYGVKRAIQLAEDSAQTGSKSYTLGPIIHNPQMVAKMAAEGIGTIENLEEIDEGTVIIRSHGVGPKIYEDIKNKGFQLIDATCPHVCKAQKAAKQLVEEDYQVVIIGDKNHPEVKSILEWAGHDAIAIDNEEDAEALSHCRRIGVVAQTTFSSNKFKSIVSCLLDKALDVKVLRTICTATDQRQSAAVKLAKTVDMMIVVGGRNSANTTKLAQLCSDICITYHIETADEVREEWFAINKKIGITAGASTPDWIIKEVYKKCQTK